MIKFTKYFWAHVIAIMGLWMCMLKTPYPLLYGFVGGWFVGVGLKLSKKYGEESYEKNKK